jgi:hypothetical protein
MMTLAEHIELSQWMKSPALLESKMRQLPIERRLKIYNDIEEYYPIEYQKYSVEDLDFQFNRRVFDLVLGQFIMIEQIFTGKDPSPQYISDLNILCLILRPKHHKEFDNTNPEEEKLHRQKILNLDLRLAMSILKDFVDNRNKTLFEDFKGVFYDPDVDEEEDEKEEDIDDIAKSNNFEYKFKEQWYWYNIVRKLAGEDVLKYDQVYMLKMETVLPELSFLIQKSKIEKAQEFRNRVANKL